MYSVGNDTSKKIGVRMYLIFIKVLGANKIVSGDLASWIVSEGMGEIIGKVVA